MSPRPKKPALTIPQAQAETEFILRTVEALADHPDERIADLAQRAHWLIEHRPRGA